MCTVQNFIQKKKKNIRKTSRKRQIVGYWMEKGNFVQHTLPPFLLHFLSILERLNFGGPREKTAGPHHFSLPLPFSTKHTIFLLIHDYACRNFIYSLLTRVLICLAWTNLAIRIYIHYSSYLAENTFIFFIMSAVINLCY